ncbi:MAG: GMC family oxidoreductase [Actinomycetes bacterium]
MARSPSSSEVADVVVVGAGPSGAVVSKTLSDKGFSVVCLEQGDWVNPSDFPGNRPDFELLIQRRWSHDPNVRKLAADYPLNNSESDMSPVMYNAVGGGSVVYGAHWHRLTPGDFRVRTVDGVADDWPLTYAALVPYYEAVESVVAVSGLEGDPVYPEGLTYSQPPLPLGPAGRRAAEAANSLGWHWWPGSQAISSVKHGHVEGCARFGVCEWGCPQGAKASFDRVFWPSALQSGTRLVTGARVRRVCTDSRGRASGVEWVDRDGRNEFLRARAVVLCANGIGTARLLLLSATTSQPEGLANSSGLVGRNLMLHPNCMVTGFYDQPLDSWNGPAGELIYSMEFYETDPARGYARGSKLHAMPSPGPLAAIDAHRGFPFDEVWGDNFHSIAERHSGALIWGAAVEDLPSAVNRVELDDSLCDSNGIPAPKISYRVSDDTRRNLEFTVQRMRDLHLAGGATNLVDVGLMKAEGGHLLGTARMGFDPRASVVDSFGRSHDVSNLFVADGSLFVTGGAVNPTATIAALALRVAMGIVESARDLEVPW